MTPDLQTHYAGLDLRNPLIVSPAGISGTAKRMRRAEDAGCGAIVVKTLFEDEVTRKSPTPRFRVMGAREGSEKAFVLYSYEQASPFGPERYCKEIQQATRSLDIPVIASIGCMSDSGWTEYSRAVEEAGASAIELNLSCPHGRPLLSDSDVSSRMCETTALVKETVSAPVIPKMTPQAASPTEVALQLEASGADAVVMFNRFTGLDIDLAAETPVMHGGFAGHGGPWAIHYLLRWLVAATPKLGIPISASGGIWSGPDMAKAILAGATTTQMCTAIVVEGYGRITDALSGLREFMEAKGYSSLPEFRAKACGSVLSTDEIDRSRKVVASIEAGKCTSCGICERVCIYDAVSRKGTTYEIKKSV
jgi:dihydroorotate dehydrogenase (fumarate)